MIKYLIKKSKYHEWMIMAGYDFKTVSKAELKKFLSDGWEFERKEFFFFTFIKDIWNLSDKNTQSTIIFSAIIAFFSVFLSILL